VVDRRFADDKDICWRDISDDENVVMIMIMTTMAAVQSVRPTLKAFLGPLSAF